ncbi:hypothetical protein BDU57DRAFT_511902 [Ampelomyces quisqualis]|uniref:Uncharacterized protein n=1 Tax=Ampelomyces quisqualis TaxID=50730 RepID=A0A6A5QUB0_AMPQU|nr:hypothetical protein BDU57DRAFT_511902 [Ampelomyces quisqualis]
MTMPRYAKCKDAWSVPKRHLLGGNVTPHPHTKYRAPPLATVLKPFKATYTTKISSMTRK